MKKYSLSALVAAGLLAGGLATSANAADLGGNCCADLEERIAELEATTARKGNRKVSLTVSGWVAEQVMWWDDGEEDNVYVAGLGTTLATNVKFTGQATISPGVSAGYVIHMEAIDSDSLTHNADSAVGPALYDLLGGGTSAFNVQVIQSYWFLKSDHWGKVSVGQQSQASDNTALLVDGSGTLVPANWVAFDVNSFAIRNNGAVALTWGGAGSCRGMGGAWGDCNGLTQEAVRYDSPTFAGFSVSASWGADDFWDVAARYAGEFSGIKLAAAVAYNEVNDEFYNLAGGPQNGLLDRVSVIATGLHCTPACVNYPAGVELEYFQAGVYAQHVPTGLWVLYNYGHLDDNFTAADSAETHYVKVGVRGKWHPWGATIPYIEYLTTQDGPFDGAELEVWGAGIAQEIDPAAMTVWLKYRNLDFDDNTNVKYEDFDQLSIGGLINF